MKGIIILEGADASGKSTLANKLIEKNKGGIYIHATYRFKDKMPIYHAALLRKALKLSKNNLVIIDRLHISEYIYAKVFRKGTKWPEYTKMFNSFCRYMNIPIILCVPENIKRGKIWFEKSRNERIEMYNNIDKIIEEYFIYADKHKFDKNIILYNRDYAEAYQEDYINYIIKLLKFKSGEINNEYQ